MEAISALEKTSSLIAPHLLVSEIRTIAADDLWMSQCYGQTCAAFHFTWKQNVAAINKVLPMIEDEIAPFRARPHWGKLFTTRQDTLAGLYKRLPDFRDLTEHHDPDGKFRNAFVSRNIFAVESN